MAGSRGEVGGVDSTVLSSLRSSAGRVAFLLNVLLRLLPVDAMLDPPEMAPPAMFDLFLRA